MIMSARVAPWLVSLATTGTSLGSVPVLSVGVLPSVVVALIIPGEGPRENNLENI